MHRLDQRLLRIGPANTLRRKTVDFRKGPHRDNVAIRLHQSNAVFIVALGKLGIGAVEHEDAVGRQRGVEAADFAGGQQRSGRIVGVGEKDDFRPLSHASEQRIDVGAIVRVWGDHRRRSDPPRSDVIHCEPVADVQDLITDARKRSRHQMQQFVRSGAADDALRVDAMRRRQRLTQPG